MASGNPGGSTWKKWDLHVHSPCSIVQGYGANTDAVWDRFLSDLENLPPEFKVIGINDYIFVDGYERVRKAKRAGRLQNIDLILPVVELRLDKFAGVVTRNRDGSYSRSDWNRINLHVIFDSLDPEVIRQQFISALAPSYNLVPDASSLAGKWHAVITRESVAQLGEMAIAAAPAEKRGQYGSALEEGFNNLCVSQDAVLKALDKHPLFNRYLLAVGKTEWENLKWDGQSIAEKRNIINCVDLVFTAAENPHNCDAARQKLMASNVNAKLLDCSDAHNFSGAGVKDRIGNCFTWIKADATFEGLRQAVKEFDQRVFIGDVPPKLNLVKANRTKYVSGISIKKKAGSSLVEPWFDIDLPLNHDLVAIIGNKGSGKSALADIAALVGNTRNHQKFSFLTDSRFRDPKAKLATHFEAQLLWEDGTSSSQDLHVNPAPSSVERLKYLPQSYLETLCNELGGGSSSTFDSELRKIIYTHVPEEERLGFLSLEELLDFKVREIEAERHRAVQELAKINEDFSSIERKLAPESRRALEQQLDGKRNELRALEAAKPVPVEDPNANEATKADAAAANVKLQELEGKLAVIRNAEQEAREKRTAAMKRAVLVNRLLHTVKEYTTTHDQFLVELDESLAAIDINVSAREVLTLTVDTSSLTKLYADLGKEIHALEVKLTGDVPDSLQKQREGVEKDVETIKRNLGEQQRLLMVFREQLSQWERKRGEILGPKERPQSIAWLEAELLELEQLPAKQERLKESRNAVVVRLHEHTQRTVSEYRRLSQPVQQFVQSVANMDMPLPLEFNVTIVEEGFQERFFSRINRQARGSFYGVDESAQIILGMLRETDFSGASATLDFVNRVDDMMHFDRREGAGGGPMQPNEQLRRGQEVKDLYDFLFGLSYLRPRYSLTYGGQEISRLSPGERGLLLLVFYLLVDKDDIPLVIDQPEENLDNQTIYKVLVTCIKAAKQRRQVIMVTHNPNLAVVCDAEQIICASCDKANSRFSYACGAIEFPEIKAKVIEILEGTRPAFINRQQKYDL